MAKKEWTSLDSFIATTNAVGLDLWFCQRKSGLAKLSVKLAGKVSFWKNWFGFALAAKGGKRCSRAGRGHVAGV